MGQNESQEDDTGIVERGHDADGVGFKGREDAEEDEVGGVALSFPVGKAHEYQSADGGDEHQPRM